MRKDPWSRRVVGIRLATLALALPLIASGASKAIAATPATDHITAPDTGSVTKAWTGTVPPGSGGIQSCVELVNSDVYGMTLDPLAPTFYASHSATLQFTITWVPASQQTTQDSVKSVRVTIMGETAVERPEMFYLDLSGAQHASIARSRGICTIRQN